MSLENIINTVPPPPPEEGAEHDAKAHAPAVPYRSWRKKYKKMRQRFSDAMNESNRLARSENRAQALARRLQEENDQFLETLLDIYEDGSLEFSPQETGFDVYSDLASLTTAKTVETDEEVLNSLLQMPHKSYTLADVPEDVNNACSSNFLDPTYRDEYLSHLDSQLLEAPLPDDVFAKQSRPPSSRVLLSEKELANQNADSVISWLRRNHPETFIQDGEKEKTEPRKRGGGKRASLAQPTATVKHEHEDGDDDMSYVTEPPEKPARGRKSKDDEPYRPKGGSSRSTKRKRAADDGEKGRGKRAKANAS